MPVVDSGPVERLFRIQALVRQVVNGEKNARGLEERIGFPGGSKKTRDEPRVGVVALDNVNRPPEPAHQLESRLREEDVSLHVVGIAFFGGWIVVDAVAVKIIRGGKK